jgi:hypothetical protein
VFFDLPFNLKGIHKYPENSIIIAPIECAILYGLNIYLDDLPTNKGYITTIFLVKKHNFSP